MSIKIRDFGRMVSNHKATYMCVASYICVEGYLSLVDTIISFQYNIGLGMHVQTIICTMLFILCVPPCCSIPTEAEPSSPEPEPEPEPLLPLPTITNEAEAAISEAVKNLPDNIAENPLKANSTHRDDASSTSSSAKSRSRSKSYSRSHSRSKSRSRSRSRSPRSRNKSPRNRRWSYSRSPRRRRYTIYEDSALNIIYVYTVRAFDIPYRVCKITH